MPIITLTLRGNELSHPTRIILERTYNFSKLKLAHIYHNIDAQHFKAKGDQASAKSLFIKLGGLCDNSKQVINYTGDYETSVNKPVRGSYSGTDETTQEVSVPTASTQAEANIFIDHIIPIGASKANSKELISRDLHTILHDGGELNFSGELVFSLYYMNQSGAINPVSTATGGIYSTIGKDIPITHLTMVLSYEENQPN